MPVTIPAVGTAEPLVTVQVRAQVTGQLSRVHFREGQDVNKGDTLLSLDSRPFEAALRQAEAVLARDTAQSKNAQAQQTRYKELFDRGLIPRDQYETQAATASALEATLAADLSQVENARLSLQYATIKAPMSGRTGALAVHEGDLIRANDTAPLVVINQVAPIYVSFSVPGRYLPQIRQNQARQPLRIQAGNKSGEAPGAPPGVLGSPAPAPVQASGPASGSLNEGGVVTFIDNAVDPTTGTIKLKGTFANADHALWPGLFVQVTLVLSTDPKGHRRAGCGRSGIAGRPVRVRGQGGSHRRAPQRHDRTAARRGDGDRAGLERRRRDRHRRSSAADARRARRDRHEGTG